MWYSVIAYFDCVLNTRLVLQCRLISDTVHDRAMRVFTISDTLIFYDCVKKVNALSHAMTPNPQLKLLVRCGGKACCYTKTNVHQKGQLKCGFMGFPGDSSSPFALTVTASSWGSQPSIGATLSPQLQGRQPILFSTNQWVILSKD